MALQHCQQHNDSLTMSLPVEPFSEYLQLSVIHMTALLVNIDDPIAFTGQPITQHPTAFVDQEFTRFGENWCCFMVHCIPMHKYAHQVSKQQHIVSHILYTWRISQ